MQWSDFQSSYLTAGQQTKASQFEAIGRALRLSRIGQGPAPDVLALLGGVTAATAISQAKAAKLKNDDIRALVDAAVQGAEYVIKTLKDAAGQSFDDANP